MKIRTDFVTNSSSSSFILDTFNNKKITTKQGEDYIKYVLDTIAKELYSMENNIRSKDIKLFKRIEEILVSMQTYYKEYDDYREEIHLLHDELSEIKKSKILNEYAEIAAKNISESLDLNDDTITSYDVKSNYLNVLDLELFMIYYKTGLGLIDASSMKELLELDESILEVIAWYDGVADIIVKSIGRDKLSKYKYIKSLYECEDAFSQYLYKDEFTYDEFIDKLSTVSDEWVSFGLILETLMHWDLDKNSEASKEIKQGIFKAFSENFGCGLILGWEGDTPRLLDLVLQEKFKYVCTHMA